MAPKKASYTITLYLWGLLRLFAMQYCPFSRLLITNPVSFRYFNIYLIPASNNLLLFRRIYYLHPMVQSYRGFNYYAVFWDTVVTRMPVIAR